MCLNGGATRLGIELDPVYKFLVKFNDNGTIRKNYHKENKIWKKVLREYSLDYYLKLIGATKIEHITLYE